MTSKFAKAAQSGGGESAVVSRQLFLAFKSASETVELRGFPVEELCYILRVGGPIQDFEVTDGMNAKYDKRDSAISVDIEVPERIWKNNGDLFAHVDERLRRSIGIAEQIVVAKKLNSERIYDRSEFSDSIEKFISEYRAAIQVVGQNK